MFLTEKYKLILAYTTEPDADGNFTSHELEVTPLNPTITIQAKKDRDQIFLRKEIKDGLTFNCEAYDWLYAFETGYNRYRPLTLHVTLRSDESAIYDAVAYMDDADWTTIPSRYVTLKFNTYDKFNLIDEVAENKKNLFGATATRHNLRSSYVASGLTKIEKQTISTITDVTLFYTVPTGWLPTWPKQSEGWVLLTDRTKFIAQGAGANNKVERISQFAREITVATWTPTSFPYAATWTPVYAGGNTYYTRLIESVLADAESTVDAVPLGTAPASWTLTLWNRKYFWPPEDAKNYDNALKLTDAITHLLAGTGITLSSHLLGVGSYGTRPTYYDNLTEWESTYIYQKSDISRVNAQQNASNNPVSLKQLLNELREASNVYWTVKGNVFLLEHRSFFEQQDSDLRPFIKQNPTGWTYEGKQIPDREEFANFETIDGGWRNGTFQYKGLLVGHQRFTEQRTVTASVNYAITEQGANQSSTDGYVIVHGKEHGGQNHIAHEITTYKVDNWVFSAGLGYINQPIIVNKTLLNGYLAPTQRASKLLCFHRPWKSSQPPFVQSRQRFRKEVTLVLVPCEIWSFDFDKLQRSFIGWGEVESYEYDILNGRLDINLLHLEINEG
jgi:hypothetical protein